MMVMVPARIGCLRTRRLLRGEEDCPCSSGRELYVKISKRYSNRIPFTRRLNVMTSNWRSREEVTGQTPPPNYSEANGVNLFFRQLSRQFSRSRSNPSPEGRDGEGKSLKNNGGDIC